MSTNPQSMPGEFEVRGDAAKPPAPPAPAPTDEEAFMEELRRRMESPETPIPVEIFLAELDEIEKDPSVTPDESQ
jgi:hypothetical protein